MTLMKKVPPVQPAAVPGVSPPARLVRQGGGEGVHCERGRGYPGCERGARGVA